MCVLVCVLTTSRLGGERSSMQQIRPEFWPSGKRVESHGLLGSGQNWVPMPLCRRSTQVMTSLDISDGHSTLHTLLLHPSHRHTFQGSWFFRAQASALPLSHNVTHTVKKIGATKPELPCLPNNNATSPAATIPHPLPSNWLQHRKCSFCEDHPPHPFSPTGDFSAWSSPFYYITSTSFSIGSSPSSHSVFFSS